MASRAGLTALFAFVPLVSALHTPDVTGVGARFNLLFIAWDV